MMYNDYIDHCKVNGLTGCIQPDLLKYMTETIDYILNPYSTEYTNILQAFYDIPPILRWVFQCVYVKQGRRPAGATHWPDDAGIDLGQQWIK